MKFLSTRRMRLRKLPLDYSVSVAGPWPNSRYYPVPDDTLGAKTLEELQAEFDAQEKVKEQRKQEEQQKRRWEVEGRKHATEAEAELAAKKPDVSLQHGRFTRSLSLSYPLAASGRWRRTPGRVLHREIAFSVSRKRWGSTRHLRKNPPPKLLRR